MSDISGAYIPRERLRSGVADQLRRIPAFFKEISGGVMTGVVAGLENQGGVALGEASVLIREPADAPRLFAAGQHRELPEPELSLGEKAKVGPYVVETQQRDESSLGVVSFERPERFFELDGIQMEAYRTALASNLTPEAAIKAATGQWPAVLDGNVWVEAFEL